MGPSRRRSRILRADHPGLDRRPADRCKPAPPIRSEAHRQVWNTQATCKEPRPLRSVDAILLPAIMASSRPRFAKPRRLAVHRRIENTPTCRHGGWDTPAGERRPDLQIRPCPVGGPPAVCVRRGIRSQLSPVVTGRIFPQDHGPQEVRRCSDLAQPFRCPSNEGHRCT